MHGSGWRCAGALLVALLVFPTAAPSAREISAQEAAAQAQQEADGKVLSVQALTLGKRRFFRIKILTHDGQVRVVQIAAEQ